VTSYNECKQLRDLKFNKLNPYTEENKSHDITRVLGLPDGEEIMPLALTQYRRMTDRQTERQTDGHVAVPITRASIASRG